jgi:UPF0716 protein FxsA
MLIYLLILFTVVPAVELYLLISVGRTIGAWDTILIIVLTGIIGSWVAKRQGASTWREIRETLSRGEFPGKQLIDAVLIFAAGLLMITPGFLTDIFGFLVMVPAFRTLVRSAVSRVLKNKLASATIVTSANVHVRGTKSGPFAGEDVIDVTATEVKEPDDDIGRLSG